jgi:hypothetical protein
MPEQILKERRTQTTNYHRTECGEFRVGDVIRLKADRGFRGAFSDMVILGFDEQGDALLARPYAYASGVGTQSPTPQTGVERVEHLGTKILEMYEVVSREHFVFAMGC